MNRINSTMGQFLIAIIAVTAFADEPQTYGKAGRVSISELGQKFSFELTDLVEGLGKGVAVELENDSGVELRNIQSSVSCSCLGVAKVDGENWQPKSVFTVPLLMVPTSTSHFDQECTITGATPDGKRVQVCRLNLRGPITPPVSMGKTGLLLTDIKDGRYAAKLSCTDGVEVDYSKVTSREKWLAVKGNASTGTLEFEFSGPLKLEMASLVTVPFRYRNRTFMRTFPIEIVDEYMQLSVHRIIFRRDKDLLIGNVFLTFRGQPATPDRIDAQFFRFDARAG